MAQKERGVQPECCHVNNAPFALICGTQYDKVVYANASNMKYMLFIHIFLYSEIYALQIVTFHHALH